MRYLVTGLLLVCLSHNVKAQRTDFAHVNFTRADSIAALYRGHSLDNLVALSHKLSKPLDTDVEKFRGIYKWICENIDNDYRLYTKTVAQRKKHKTPEEFKTWNKEFNERVFADLVKKRSTICSGYAFLLRELSLHAGLSCEIINGYGRTSVSNVGGPGIANHTWNAVQLNNKWYLCDATWSSGAINLQEARFVKKFNEAYFLADPRLFVHNHYPLDTAWLPLNDKPSLDAFLNGPLVYSPVYDYNIRELYPESFNTTARRGEPFTFRFNDGGREIGEIKLEIKTPGPVVTAFPDLATDEDSMRRVDHIFTSRGQHIVHVLLDGNYAFTYRVDVK